jgi:hypothetical protein
MFLVAATNVFAAPAGSIRGREILGLRLGMAQQDAIKLLKDQQFQEIASQVQARAFKQEDDNVVRIVNIKFTSKIADNVPAYVYSIEYRQKFSNVRTDNLKDISIEKFGRPDRSDPIRDMSSFTLYYAEVGGPSAPRMTIFDGVASRSLTLEMDWVELQEMQQKALYEYNLEQDRKRPVARPKF